MVAPATTRQESAGGTGDTHPSRCALCRTDRSGPGLPPEPFRSAAIPPPTARPHIQCGNGSRSRCGRRSHRGRSHRRRAQRGSSPDIGQIVAQHCDGHPRRPVRSVPHLDAHHPRRDPFRTPSPAAGRRSWHPRRGPQDAAGRADPSRPRRSVAAPMSAARDWSPAAPPAVDDAQRDPLSRIDRHLVKEVLADVRQPRMGAAGGLDADGERPGARWRRPPRPNHWPAGPPIRC